MLFDNFTSNELIKSFLTLNKKHNNQELIFPLTNRGFFSEINNLALAVLYCIDNNINIKLSSKNWASGNWNDYFNPIIKEYNGLVTLPSKSIFDLTRVEKIAALYFKNVKKIDLVQTHYWKIIKHPSFLNKTFLIPELNIDGDIFHALQNIYPIILDFNKLTKNNLIVSDKETVEFSKNSFGLHIRRGDKVFGNNKEAEEIQFTDYIEKAIEIDNSIKSFIVCTDDYSLIESIKLKYHEFVFKTLCAPTKNGYNQTTYNNLKDKNLKSKEVLDVLNDAILLSNSKYFIGTNSSNLSRFVTLVRNNENSYSMDKTWYPG
ncbi:hypothetical protein [uncultured Algibacter sp.]|uniref:hypothetical protein n=1 Tax=uncultured Algibacter sp. TaxID=298659 RepID=UPI0026283682|nr:hypothetical protein [uncultured Algibacter sp.]